MGRLSDDLQEMGFVTTGEESPVDENGIVWKKGIETVCDETGVIIDGNHHGDDQDTEQEFRCGEPVFRYRNSERVKMVGGYLGNYDW